MGDAEQLSGLVGDIYDAALDTSLWPAALARVAAFVGGPAAGIFTRDSVYQEGNLLYEVGADRKFAQLYFEKYIKLDPAIAAYLVFESGEVFSNSQIVPEAEFRETRFFKEWVEPQGWVDNVCVNLDKSATSRATLAVFRHERDGLADDAARDRLRLLAPHLRRAVLIGKVIGLKIAEAATFADTLDGIGAGMLLVDAGGRIAHANAAGFAMLHEADFLRADGGRLLAGDPEADKMLADVLAAAGGGDAALGTGGIAIPLTSRGGQRYVAHVLPLTSGARRRAGTAYAAVAAVFVHKAALDTPSPPEVIAKTYRLTPGELRVLLAIVEVGGVPDVAEALGIAETTVKFHLGHLFQKTGARRQADLVKLVAGYSTPLVG